MAPSSQGLEPQANPGRFSVRLDRDVIQSEPQARQEGMLSPEEFERQQKVKTEGA